MPKLFRYLLLSFSLLLFRYALSFLVVSFFPNSFSDGYSLNTIPDLWLKGEVGGSFEVASVGYKNVFEKFTADYEILRTDWYVLPLYPFILKIIIDLVGSLGFGEYILHAGPVLSALFLGLFLFFLDKLLEKVWLYDDKKYFVILLILLFPSAFVLTMPGPLTLFMLLSTLFFYFLFQRKYALAAIFLSLSMATKVVAFIYIIPFFYFVSMAERYNPKFPKTSKSLGYAGILTLPVLLSCYSTFEKAGDFFLFFKPSYWFSDFNFIPFAPLVRFIASKSYLSDVTSGLNAVALISLSVMITYVFIRMYFIFENRSVEQNMLFMTGFLSLLAVSVLPLSLNVVGAILSVVPFFMLFAMVATFPVRSPGFLALLFVLLNIQTLMFINFLM